MVSINKHIYTYTTDKRNMICSAELIPQLGNIQQKERIIVYICSSL